ncbi:hypothetical protein AURDEDRAFT_115455 [Auricularia subglabra TFB-10046 SS5]|uniref:Mid2 domain-containing protein n=1 Tax=Auricularia subglabra (strain TFB-10046 / SS5) TaxID=717982 RepID=J0LK50_AURST|nr:hypothetical protein AURDEDRAFT_115455 [Auricularia subglabra TFB-10046 SS5]
MRRRWPLLFLAAAGAEGVSAADTTLEWTFDAGAGLRTPVPACRDENGVRLNSGTSANLTFNGREISLYGTRYAGGAAAVLVVDGQYSQPVYADEGLGAGSEGGCYLLASFAGLNGAVPHTVTVSVNGPDMGEEYTFTIANVTTNETPYAAPTSAAGSAHRPVSVGAIVGIVIGAVVVIAALAVLARFLSQRRARRKAPSAAFRAEHPELAQLPPQPLPPPGSIRGLAPHSPSPTGFFPRDEKRTFDSA